MTYDEHIKRDTLMTAIILAGMLADKDGYHPSEEAILIAFDCTRTINEKVTEYVVDENGKW